MSELIISPGKFEAYIPVDGHEQRTKPRDLWPAEMWAGYEKMPDEMKMDWAIKDYTVPDLHPYQRTTYELLSPAMAANEHTVRLCKQGLRNDYTLVWEFKGDDDKYDAHCKKMRDYRHASPTHPPLAERFQKAEDDKQKAKSYYRAGMFQVALLAYFSVWSELPPYSTGVLSPDDPNKASLGRL
ncbi:hypothetical protein IAT38_002976 [Cryptococcus sp. DSM 104549]